MKKLSMVLFVLFLVTSPLALAGGEDSGNKSATTQMDRSVEVFELWWLRHFYRWFIF